MCPPKGTSGKLPLALNDGLWKNRNVFKDLQIMIRKASYSVFESFEHIAA